MTQTYQKINDMIKEEYIKQIPLKDRKICSLKDYKEHLAIDIEIKECRMFCTLRMKIYEEILYMIEEEDKGIIVNFNYDMGDLNEKRRI